MADRTCGRCSECCVHVKVDAFNKPPGEPCLHLNVLQDCGSCGIYEDRPSECKQYRCSWLEGELTDDMKPELCGILLETARLPNWHKPLVLLLGFEHVPGAIYKYFDQLNASAKNGKIIGVVPHKDSPYNDIDCAMFGEPDDAREYMAWMEYTRRVGKVVHQYNDATIEQTLED